MISSSCLRFNVVHVNAKVTSWSLMKFCSLRYSLLVGLWGMIFAVFPARSYATTISAGVTTDVSAVVDPVITVRFANPQFSCSTYEYCLDVEFQSDTPNKELFGMNVRFFLDDHILEFVNFRGFQGGYGAVTPNPANVNFSTSGVPWFNFTDGADYINGAIQKVNTSAPAIYISTSGWTKLYQACFIVDYHNGSETNFWPSVVWDLEVDPADGGYPPGSGGPVMTVVGGGNVVEHVNQFNWEYSGNGLAPYGQPVQESTISIDCGSCNKVVTSSADSGANTLRAACQCAYSGDTITFGTGMAGATINFTSNRILFSKNLFIRSNLSPHVKITSQIAGLFDILPNSSVEFKDLDITSGLQVPNNAGAAFKNEGMLKFINVKVFKNANLAAGQFLISNKPKCPTCAGTVQFSSVGNCYVEIP